MAEDAADERSRDRSPSFPFISLEKAVERAAQFDALYKRSAGRIANVLPVWEFSAKSSSGLQTVGALIQFGLLDDEGSGAERKVKLTDVALRILKDERPGKRQEAIKEAALKPKIMAELWAHWGLNRPPDAECLSELTLERKFTEAAATRLLRVYDDTIEYAGLAGPDKIRDDEGATPDKGKPADPQGVGTGDQFREASPSPLRVKPMDAHLQDIFNVDEGQAVIQWPAGMTSASYEDFVAWLDIVKRKIKRQIDAAEKTADSELDSIVQ